MVHATESMFCIRVARTADAAGSSAWEDVR